jgi:primase-polymerase (primpol)-like protein
MDTYTEKSPSGTGYHLIFKCDMSKIPTINGKLDERYYLKNPHNDLECYFAGLTNRYFTYTGEIVNDKNIEDRTEQILIFLENYMLKDNFKKKKEDEPPQKTRSSVNYTFTDILDRARNAKNGVKFSTLYDRGDISTYNNDDSAADQA